LYRLDDLSKRTKPPLPFLPPHERPERLAGLVGFQPRAEVAAFFLGAGDEGFAVAEHRVAGDGQGFGGAGGEGGGQRQGFDFEVASGRIL